MENEEKSLSEEIFLNIFSYLDHSGLSSVRLVCHEWKELAEPLWKNLQIKKFVY